jgi:Spy/CpxP family protein refolding chaperone
MQADNQCAVESLTPEQKREFVAEVQKRVETQKNSV